MKKKFAILCPGQGAQNRGMFDLARTDPRFESLLEKWRLDAILGLPLQNVMEEEAHLYANRVAQPLIVAATLATWEALKDALPLPALVAGYSIGEVASHAIAGSLSSGEAIRLAASRAKFMDACVSPSDKQVLIALTGLRKSAVRYLVDSHACFIAIEIDEDSLIIGGLDEAVAGLRPALIKLGGRITTLPVGIASHTPLMQSAALAFLVEMGHYQFIDPVIPVLSGITGEKMDRKEQVPPALSRQIAATIRWRDCMDTCSEAGIGAALELGPGSALSGMLKARHPHIECRSVAEFRSVAGISRWLHQHLN
jgi:[acyl-carrier-protein] S-malonyltransferase